MAKFDSTSLPLTATDFLDAFFSACPRYSALAGLHAELTATVAVVGVAGFREVEAVTLEGNRATVNGAPLRMPLLRGLGGAP